MKTKKIQFKFRRLELYLWLKSEAKKKDQPLTSFINDILDKLYYSHQNPEKNG